MTTAIGTWARKGMTAGLGGLVAVAAAGCGTSAPSTTGQPATSAPATAHGSASPTASQTPAPNGATLNTLLLPASAMPSGYQLDPSGSRNTGQSLPQDIAQPVPASQLCGKLDGTGWILVGGIATADFAENDYVNSAKTAELGQEIDQFTAGDAKQVMARIWRVFGRCGTFTQRSNGTTATDTLVRSRLRHVGDGGIEAVLTAPVFYGGTTLVAIRVGNAVVTFIDSSPNSDLGAAAVTLAERIVHEIRALQNG